MLHWNTAQRRDVSGGCFLRGQRRRTASPVGSEMSHWLRCWFGSPRASLRWWWRELRNTNLVKVQEDYWAEHIRQTAQTALVTSQVAGWQWVGGWRGRWCRQSVNRPHLFCLHIQIGIINCSLFIAYKITTECLRDTYNTCRAYCCNYTWTGSQMMFRQHAVNYLIDSFVVLGKQSTLVQ